MLVDQGSVFLSAEWRSACNLNGIELSATGIESHNSLASGETYHAYLRRCYDKVRKDFAHLGDELILAIAVKAVNDTAGPYGLVPSLLVFGMLPRIPNDEPRVHPQQHDRLRAALAARREFERIISAERLRLASRAPVTIAADNRFDPGDLVYAYRERLRKYTGPHMIATANGKHVRLHISDPRGPRSFNTAQIRRAPLPNAYAQRLAQPAIKPQIMHTEVLPIGDAREGLFDEAKRSELLDLIRRGTFKIVLRDECGKNPSVVPSRFVLAIKHTITGEQKLKARFVLGGHCDDERKSLIHDSPTVRPESVRMLIALATILGFNIKLVDWRQGYTQALSNLLRACMCARKSCS